MNVTLNKVGKNERAECSCNTAWNCEVSQVSDKSLIGAKIAFVIVGFLGVHRFYSGRPISGIFIILTLGGLGIYWILFCLLPKILETQITSALFGLISNWLRYL